MRTLASLAIASTLACTLTLAFVGCGTSKTSSGKTQDSGVDSGSSQPSAMKPRPDGGTSAKPDAAISSGTLMEGEQCQLPSDCMKGLICAAGNNGSVSANFCARACTTSSDCGTESCYSQTGLDADAHCVNIIREEFADCGLADTSVCGQPLTCLYGQTSALGICITLCDLATGDDAGTSSGSACASDQICLGNIVASDTQGVCGKMAARGDACGVDKGTFCSDTDICAPEDATDASSASRCYEDCTDTSKCSSGKCTSFHSIAYCK